MEKEERYRLYNYGYSDIVLYDYDIKTEPSIKDVEKLLNQQDKHIKELERLLKADKKIKTNSLNGFEKLRQENQQLKQQVREEVVKEVRKRLKKANFEIMSPTDPYSYTDNFLYQVEKGETK